MVRPWPGKWVVICRVERPLAPGSIITHKHQALTSAPALTLCARTKRTAVKWIDNETVYVLFRHRPLSLQQCTRVWRSLYFNTTFFVLEGQAGTAMFPESCVSCRQVLLRRSARLWQRQKQLFSRQVSPSTTCTENTNESKQILSVRCGHETRYRMLFVSCTSCTSNRYHWCCWMGGLFIEVT